MSLVAKRYAEALFELATDKGLVAEVGADLKEVKAVLASNEELVAVFNAPKVSVSTKKEMIQNLFGGAQAIVVNTLGLLLDKKRFNDVAFVADHFASLAAAAASTAEATVVSTRPLTAEEQTEISAAFGKLVGVETLQITNEIDASLLGGVRVQIGNYIYDSSVASKLEGLKRTLVG